MGRALFSQNFIHEPTIRALPEPALGPHAPYSKWSIWNDFDPDSDEFFRDAEYEAFIDPGQYQADQAPVDPSLPPLLEDVDSSSSSSEGSDTDRTSPMAVGLDDPEALLATAYPAHPLTRRWAAREPTSPTIRDNEIPVLEDTIAPAQVAPPLHYSIPDEMGAHFPSTPLPVFSAGHLRSMSTDAVDDHEMAEISGSHSPSSSPFMTTPSPATSVSPLLYNWRRRYIATSPSPAREGPLTNPSARMSLTHIPPVPARVRIQGFSV